ncbi:MAG: hypothetical protein HGA38_02880 [Candidatus Moranbacteria bacterium]|nr:hypothetical protein [Candidatus Moranbacteria bacterium]
MSIKKLAFPIFMAVAVFVGIFSVRPSFISVVEKSEARSAKDAELQVVEATKQNLETLSLSRASLLDADEGRAVYSYLPADPEQERVVDLVNFYAVRSGISLIDVSSLPDNAVRTDQALADDGTAGEGKSSAPTAPGVESFTLEVELQGPYQGVRSFLESLSHASRSHRLLSFSIDKKQSAAVDNEGNPLPDSGILTGTLKMRFFHLPERRYAKGYLLPVFASSQFELGPVRELMASERDVPELPASSGAGRENPFTL